MISDQNCTTRSSITTLLHPFRNHTIINVHLKQALKNDWLFYFSVYFSLAGRGRGGVGPGPGLGRSFDCII